MGGDSDVEQKLEDADALHQDIFQKVAYYYVRGGIWKRQTR